MTVDIVVNVYNEGKNVGAFLDSLLAQTYRDFRVLIVDDGSTDNTVAVVEGYQPKLNIEIIRLNHVGLEVSRAVGIKAATGPIFIVFDADEVILPQTVEHMVRAFDDPQVAGVTGIKVSKGSSWTERGQRVLARATFNALRAGSGETDQLSGGCLACRTEVVKELGGFVAHNRYAEDAEIAWRLHKAGWKTIADERIVVLHNDPVGAVAMVKWGFRMGCLGFFARMTDKSKFLKPYVLIRFMPLLLLLVLPFRPLLALLGYLLLFVVFQYQVRNLQATWADKALGWVVFLLKSTGWNFGILWTAGEYVKESAAPVKTQLTH